MIERVASGKSSGQAGAWRIYYWAWIVALFAFAAWQRFSLPLDPIADPDTWGYLSPALRKLTGLEFGHTYARHFVYPAFVFSILRIFGDFRAIVISQHLSGLLAGGLLLITWRRARVFVADSRLSPASHDILGLLAATVFLLAGEPIRFEMQLRPEGLCAFLVSLNLYFALQFIACCFVEKRPRATVGSGIGTAFTSILLASAKPSFALMALVVFLPVGIFFFRRGWHRQKIAVVAGVAACVALLLLPEHFLSGKDEASRRFLWTTLFVTHAHLIRDQMAQDLERDSALIYPRERLARIHTALRAEILKSAAARPGHYWSLGFDPDYLMYDASSIDAQLRQEFDYNDAELYDFYRFYYWRLWKERPFLVLKKITNQMSLFYSEMCPAYNREKTLSLGNEYADGTTFLSTQPYPELWATYPPAVEFMRRTKALAQTAPVIRQPVPLRLTLSFLSGLYRPLLWIAVALATVVLFRQQYRNRLGWLGLVVLFVYSYNVAACLEVAILNSLEVRRYVTVQIFFTLFAQFLALWLLWEWLFNARREKVADIVWPAARGWSQADSVLSGRMSEPVVNAIASASELVVRFGNQAVLDHATVTILEGERVGLVGRNGSGKSTFLQIAAGVMKPDSGEFNQRRDLVVGYMPQMFELSEKATVHANILSGAQGVLDLIAEYELAPAEGARSGILLDQISHFDGWNLEHRIKSLITNLHAPDPERIVASLSGGEKRRVALCRSLLARPDFLILDEPTNHLDTESIEWLEDFLARYSGTCLFVTHDRYFLDRIATRVVELSRGKFSSYDGNYTDYLLARAERAAVEEMQEHKRQKFLKRELEWVRKAPRARRTKSVDRVERYFEMAQQGPPEAELDVDLIIPPAPKLANRVIELREVGIDLGGRTLFQNVSLNLAAGERLGIVGRNGLGKSTLLKIMLQQLEPTTGVVEIGSRTEINYVDQNRLLLDDSKTVWEEVGEGSEYVRLGEENITLRGYLRRFLFTEERINTKINQLSGGERSRVLLAKILKRGGNVLILDEPTNDLDLGTLRLLEEALVAFGGSVIVVSHDRYFLNRVCTAILAFEGDGVLRYGVGNYDYYLEKRSEAVQATKIEQLKPSAVSKPAAKARKLKWKEERELEGMEAAILTAENEVARIEALFAEPDFYTTHATDFAKIEVELVEARHEVARLYARWAELGEVAGTSG